MAIVDKSQRTSGLQDSPQDVFRSSTKHSCWSLPVLEQWTCVTPNTSVLTFNQQEAVVNMCWTPALQ